MTSSVSRPSTLLSVPFRNASGPHAGNINVIPLASAAPLASFADGLPIETMLPKSAGGVPPSGGDFNGLFHLITSHLVWQNAGGLYGYDAALSALIGGYPKGAMLLLNDGATAVISTVDGNTQDPNSALTGWLVFNYRAKEAAGHLYSSLGAITAANKMLGVGFYFTPKSSGSVLLLVSGSLSNSAGTSASTTGVLQYGTGTAPAHNDAQSGLNPVVGNQVCVSCAPGTFAVQAVVTGLTVGTRLWADLSLNPLAGVGGNAAGVNDVQFSVVEL